MPNGNGENRLLGRLFVSGRLETLTGLHIGGAKTALDIGGIDNNVIKTVKGVPFIPGSSLKGKLRSLVELAYGFDGLCDDINHESGIALIFGFSKGDGESNKSSKTRLIVRDAFLDEDDFREKFKDEELNSKYTEEKWENTIEGLTSKAKSPRVIERVPAGSVFNFEIIYNVFNKDDIDRFKTVIEAMRMLEDDYLGGNGSRGYGRVKFRDLKFEFKTPVEYESQNKRLLLREFDYIDFDTEDLLKKIRERLGCEES